MADIQYSQRGYFDFGTIHRLSDGSIIKIPYRMVKYEPVLSYNNFNVVANTALEFRLKDTDDIFGSKFVFDLELTFYNAKQFLYINLNNLKKNISHKVKITSR